MRLSIYLFTVCIFTSVSFAQERGGAVCCMPDDTNCYIINPNDCEMAGGTIISFDPADCDNNPCGEPAGDPDIACCLTSYSCVVTTAENCTVVGGTVFSEDPMACLSDPCSPKGACCYVDPDEVDYYCDQKTEEACINNGGSFKGVNLTCSEYVCLTDRGGCCINDGCVMLYGPECDAVSGVQSECDACEPVQETCQGDLDGDGIVKLSDLLILIGAWGVCP